MWLGYRPGHTPYPLQEVWSWFDFRWSIEPSIRFRKQGLLWTLPAFHSSEACGRWSHLVFLARPLVRDQPLPWQKAQVRLTPGRVRRGLALIFSQLSTPAQSPKTCGKLIWQELVKRSGADQATIQIIDTLPVPACVLRRYKRRAIFPDDDVLQEPDVGYCASKDWYYFGLKGGIRIAANGMIVHAPLLEARTHDSQYSMALLAGMPARAVGLGDKGFIDTDEQIAWQEKYDLRLLPPLRQGMQTTPFQLPSCLKGLRQLIETVNGKLVERFKVQSMRIRKGWTLVAKWYRKILAHTGCVWLNLQFGHSPLDFAGLVSVK